MVSLFASWKPLHLNYCSMGITHWRTLTRPFKVFYFALNPFKMKKLLQLNDICAYSHINKSESWTLDCKRNSFSVGTGNWRNFQETGPSWSSEIPQWIIETLNGTSIYRLEGLFDKAVLDKWVSSSVIAKSLRSNKRFLWRKWHEKEADGIGDGRWITNNGIREQVNNEYLGFENQELWIMNNEL